MNETIFKSNVFGSWLPALLFICVGVEVEAHGSIKIFYIEESESHDHFPDGSLR